MSVKAVLRGQTLDNDDIGRLMRRIGAAARTAAAELATVPTDAKNAALLQAAQNIRGRTGDILSANERDVAAGEDKGLATVPGSAFGAPGHLRLAFACSREDIEEGMTLLRQALA